MSRIGKYARCIDVKDFDCYGDLGTVKCCGPGDENWNAKNSELIARNLRRPMLGNDTWDANLGSSNIVIALAWMGHLALFATTTTMTRLPLIIISKATLLTK